MYQGGKVKIAVPLEGGKRWVGEYERSRRKNRKISKRL